LGRNRSLALASGIGGARHLNSLPFYYGALTVLWAGAPTLLLFSLWLIFDSQIQQYIVIQQLPEEVRHGGEAQLNLALNQIYNVAYGQNISDAPEFMVDAARTLLRLETLSR